MGLPVRHDPKNFDSLRENREVFAIFQQVLWIVYFQRLNGIDEDMTFQFAMNLTQYQSDIRGSRIYVSEEDLVEITRLPRIRDRWFFLKRYNLIAVEYFLAA